MTSSDPGIFWPIFLLFNQTIMKKKKLTGSQMDSSKTATKTCVMRTPESILLLGWIDILNVRERSMNRREIAEFRQILISPVYVLPAQLAPMYSRYLETNMEFEFLFLRILIRFFSSNIFAVGCNDQWWIHDAEEEIRTPYFKVTTFKRMETENLSLCQERVALQIFWILFIVPFGVQPNLLWIFTFVM